MTYLIAEVKEVGTQDVLKVFEKIYSSVKN
jgi:hypothetical protein